MIDDVKPLLPAKKTARDLKSPARKQVPFGRKPIFAFVLLLAAICVAGGLTWRHFTLHKNLNNVVVIEQLVGQHYLLPKDEQPTLATVTDRSKLQTVFLRQANNGDKILIYEKAGVAIIYRPSINRIIAVGPVEVQPLKTNGQ